jgi:hypothetical protein
MLMSRDQRIRGEREERDRGGERERERGRWERYYQRG